MNDNQELQELQKAVQAALDKDWKQAHLIAQDSEHPLAHWIHAVLHKIEGDAGNSRYWYGHAHKQYETFAEPDDELQAIALALKQAISELDK